MKILHVSDFHVRLKDDNRYKTALVQAIQYILFLTKEHKPDYVVIAGDLFDTKHPTMSEFALATAFLKGLLAHTKVILVAGNHDEPANEGSHNTLQPLANLKIPGLYICEEPGLFNVDGLDILAMPYIYQERDACRAYIKKLHDEYTGDNLFLIAHAWVPGYANMICQDTEFFLSTEYLNSLTKVKHGFLGHIHLAGCAAPRMYYSGSPFRVDWGETEPIKSVYMWEDGKLMAYEVPSMPLVVCTYPDIPKDCTAKSMIKILAHGLPLDQLGTLEQTKKSLEDLGHVVKIDLELRGIKFDTINPEKKELGFVEFFDEYMSSNDLLADKAVYLDLCTKIINEQVTKDSSPFDLFKEELK